MRRRLPASASNASREALRGGNAINNRIDVGLSGVEFIVANTDAQALSVSRCRRLIQLGITAIAEQRMRIRRLRA